MRVSLSLDPPPPYRTVEIHRGEFVTTSTMVVIVAAPVNRGVFGWVLDWGKRLVELVVGDEHNDAVENAVPVHVLIESTTSTTVEYVR
ncbi:hypothetical protein MD484_g6069, partial [Candolleomyces efflorescens]